ncbi:phage tail tube protein [Rhizobium sp. Leaf341]|uniref:phage tail tube protein n=1 Tax=Rhizobium sp. Leaf341 TaxID=1736344 RepID=UPI0007146343|nr:phage tail tube protein [Rhizobium sp. Leaf341]KQR75748.1 hypothetical protein ASG03_18935 [Rhizobium sp. Leaf341]
MAKRYFRNRAILVKRETVYGTDSVPTGVANAMQMTNVEFDPAAGQEVTRDLVLPYMGHQGVILVGSYGTLAGEVEVAGSGVAGTVPAFGDLLRACAMREVITVGQDVKYNPISTGQESVSIRFNADGVQHILVGARGTWTLDMAPLAIPRFKFNLSGLLGTISDVAISTVDVSKFIKPVPVNKANTTFSLHGFTGGTEGISFDLGNQIEPDFLIGEEAIEQVDRMMTGNAVVRADLLAAINWYDRSAKHTLGTLAAVHGTTPGNIVQFDAPAVQLGRPKYGETRKRINNQLPLYLTPVVGNDEFVLTFK